MMDHIKDILASDLLERYVLGDVSQEEMMQVQLLRLEHRIVREKLDELEKTLEQTAMESAIKAPPVVRECIIKNMRNEDVTASSLTSTKSKAANSKWTANSLSLWPIAASLLLGCIATWAVMQSQLGNAKMEISEYQSELEIMHRDCDKLNQQYAFLNHTNTVPILLKGTDMKPNNQVVIYWNEYLQKSMLRVIELPGLTASETYQLWADVDGKMLSLGVFDASQAITDAIPMDFLDNATSLNITIEPRGGSDHPDVSRLTASQLI